jgi:putative GTP pyrophosphokinase
MARKRIEGANNGISLWRSQPETIKKFLDQLPDYEQLCVEVAYILEKKLKEDSIEVALVTQRAKTLNSFLEKVQRKDYADPFSEIEDFAGVRVVCLYRSDLIAIEAIISKEFDIVEKVDRFMNKSPNDFGYGAVHYVLRLGNKSVGARYDDLRNLKCEVQVRTVLQDAWAIIDHHLVYKRESDIPTQIQRKLNSLSGLFETADYQFEQVRQERQIYIDELVKSAKHEPTFLSTQINHDSLTAFLEWRFPNNKMEVDDRNQIATLLELLDRKNYQTLRQLNAKISSYIPHLDEIVARFPHQREFDSGALRLSMLLCIADSQFRQSRFIGPKARAAAHALSSEFGPKAKKSKRGKTP